MDALPKSKLDLNEFKLWFINHKDKKGAMDEFFNERFDNVGWSLWYLDYEKYGKEGQVEYIFANLLDGIIMRSEAMNKYSFGRLNMVGEEPDLNIRGVWMWRGQDYPQELKDHPQFEYIKCRKMDVYNDEKDKQLLIDHWTNFEDEKMSDGLRIARFKYQR